MKKQRGFTLIELLILLVVVFGVGGWAWNAVKLAACDFESNLKCEVIHGAGLLIPPLAIVTVWFGDDGA